MTNALSSAIVILIDMIYIEQYNAVPKKVFIIIIIVIFNNCRQEKAPDTKRKLSLRRTRRDESDLSNQKEEKVEVESKLTDPEIKDHETSTVNPGEKRKLEEEDDDVTDDEEPVQVMKKRVSLKRKKPWVSLDNSDSDDLQDVDKKGSKRSPDGLDDPLPKRIAVSDADEKAKRNNKDPL